MAGNEITGARVIVALDYPDAASALQLVAGLSPDLCRLKVGKELFTRAGPQLVEELVSSGFDGTEPTQAGRIYRDAIASTCANSKVYPGQCCF